MYKIHYLSEISQIVASVLDCVLYASVKVDGKNALRTGRYSAGA
jgi:hypothetical protein